MTELPYEIWMLIVEYLPIHQVRRLYSVNSALFNISLDLRYKQVSLGVLPDRVVEETQPPILRNPLLSSRTTVLQITLYDASNRSGPDVMPKRFPSSLKPLLQTIIDQMMGRQPKPTVKLAQLAEHVMPRLTRVTKLSFVYARVSDNSEGPYDVEASLMFPGLLCIVGNRLRALHIQSPFALYLPPRLESLESFSLDACAPYHTSRIHGIMLEKIPAFLLAQRSTIRDVSFTIDSHTFDISRILQCLQLISCLHAIRLALSYSTKATITTAVPFKEGRNILETHRLHLRSLDLRFIPDDPFYFVVVPPVFRQEREWHSVELPNLRNLTIHMPGVSFSNWDLGVYIRQFSSSLVSLRLHSDFLTSNQIKMVCKVFRDFLCLQDLSLSFDTFVMRDLSAVAVTLPYLRSLFINYYSCTILAHSGSDFSPDLCNWALESFDYSLKIPHPRCEMGRKIAIALPNVLWVQKKARSEYLLKDRKDHSGKWFPFQPK